MTSDLTPYVIGALALPALLLALAAAYLAARLLLRVAAVGIVTLGRDAPRTQRANIAAVVYGCRRARMLAFGDTAVVVIHGTDLDARKHALEALRPKIGLSDAFRDRMASDHAEHEPMRVRVRQADGTTTTVPDHRDAPTLTADQRSTDQ